MFWEKKKNRSSLDMSTDNWAILFCTVFLILHLLESDTEIYVSVFILSMFYAGINWKIYYKHLLNIFSGRVGRREAWWARYILVSILIIPIYPLYLIVLESLRIYNMLYIYYYECNNNYIDVISNQQEFLTPQNSNY